MVQTVFNRKHYVAYFAAQVDTLIFFITEKGSCNKVNLVFLGSGNGMLQFNQRKLQLCPCAAWIF
jgi:hypothetical protein